MDAHGIAEQLVPTWVPSGFEVDTIIIDESSAPNMTVFQANYCNSEKWVVVQITQHQNPDNVFYTEWQKNDGDVTPVEVGGCIYYLMDNFERKCAVWSIGPFEGYITGDITSDELSKMIQSIYEEGT